MGLSFRKSFRLGRIFRLNLTGRGVSVTARKGRVSASSRGRASVRLGKGFTWRIK